MMTIPSPGPEYLAAGFPDVDGRTDQGFYTRCLTLLDSLPYFQSYKHRSYALLDLVLGHTVLEVGCGLGDDARRLAERVGPTGLVVGLDASLRMVEEANARRPAGAPLHFLQGEARRLPFPDGCFDRCRVDRTLQHIRDPQRVIRDMVRVLAPGGLMLAYDNDWGTLAVTGTNDEATRIVKTQWEDSLTNRWIGRYLKHYFLAAGLTDLVIEPSVSVIADFDLADRVYNLREAVARAVDAGRLTPAAAAGWLEEAQALDASGGFFCNLTAYTVLGRKPGA